MLRKETGSLTNIESGMLKSCHLHDFQHCAATESEYYCYCDGIASWPIFLVHKGICAKILQLVQRFILCEPLGTDATF